MKLVLHTRAIVCPLLNVKCHHRNVPKYDSKSRSLRTFLVNRWFSAMRFALRSLPYRYGCQNKNERKGVFSAKVLTRCDSTWTAYMSYTGAPWKVIFFFRSSMLIACTLPSASIWRTVLERLRNVDIWHSIDLISLQLANSHLMSSSSVVSAKPEPGELREPLASLIMKLYRLWAGSRSMGRLWGLSMKSLHGRQAACLQDVRLKTLHPKPVRYCLSLSLAFAAVAVTAHNLSQIVKTWSAFYSVCIYISNDIEGCPFTWWACHLVWMGILEWALVGDYDESVDHSVTAVR